MFRCILSLLIFRCSAYFKMTTIILNLVGAAAAGIGTAILWNCLPETKTSIKHRVKHTLGIHGIFYWEYTGVDGQDYNYTQCSVCDYKKLDSPEVPAHPKWKRSPSEEHTLFLRRFYESRFGWKTHVRYLEFLKDEDKKLNQQEQAAEMSKWCLENGLLRMEIQRQRQQHHQHHQYHHQ